MGMHQQDCLRFWQKLNLGGRAGQGRAGQGSRAGQGRTTALANFRLQQGRAATVGYNVCAPAVPSNAGVQLVFATPLDGLSI